MNDPMRDIFKTLPSDDPDHAWLDATRRRVLDHVASQRRKQPPYHRGLDRCVNLQRSDPPIRLHAPAYAFFPASASLRSSAASNARLPSVSTPHSHSFRTINPSRSARGNPGQTATWASGSTSMRSVCHWHSLWLPRQGLPILVDHTHRAIIPINLPDEIDARSLLQFDPTTLVRRLGNISDKIKPVPISESAEHPDMIGFRIPAKAVGLSDESTLDVWVDFRYPIASADNRPRPA